MFNVQIKHREPVRSKNTLTTVPTDETTIASADRYTLEDRVLTVYRDAYTWIYNVDDLISVTIIEHVPDEDL
jgi:hypothetical protein